MNLFIDTNIFLSFYHLSSDDLEELKKLSVLLERREVVLLLPHQVRDEFRRNRDAKIADALKRFRDVRLNPQYPQLCKDYPEYSRLRELQKDFEVAHKALLERMAADVDAQSLKADSTIEQLMKLASEIPTTDELLTRARMRHDLGNPPGKRDSLGDALNWECLLERLVVFDDIHIVSDDGDYASDLSEDRLNQFLAAEWLGERQGQAILYRRLSEFFKRHFPDIKLASELEKDLAVRDLAQSSNFANTHSVVARLTRLGDFSASQSSALVDIALSNTQVRWILSDDDVSDFFAQLLASTGSGIDSEKRTEILGLLKDPDDEVESS